MLQQGHDDCAGSSAPAVVSDGHILALVVAADGLRRHHRLRHPDTGTVDADELLLRLDWTVRTGRLVLANRAALARSRPRTPAAGPEQPRRGW